jgi:antitoxin YefM
MTMSFSLTQLRPKLPEIVNRVSKYFDRCIITRHGKPEVVMLSEDDYESIMETLEIMSDQKLLKEIKQSQDDLKHGKGMSWEKFKTKAGNV